MANKHKREFDIILNGKQYTMRGTFDCFANIENDLGMGIYPFLLKMQENGEITLNQAVLIIKNGLAGAKDTRLSISEIGDYLLEDGLTNHVPKIMGFLSIALSGYKALDELEQNNSVAEESAAGNVKS